jgi:uncharacterized membrane protein YccC
MAFVFCVIAAALIAAGILVASRKFLTAGVTLIAVGILAVAGGATRILS